MEMYEGSLHLLFFHSFGHIYRLHSQRVHLGIIHAGGQRAGSWIKILNLIGNKTVFLQEQRQFHRVLESAAGMAGYKVRYQILLHSEALIGLLIFSGKFEKDFLRRFMHIAQDVF